jgi:hypothetical protein
MTDICQAAYVASWFKKAEGLWHGEQHVRDCELSLGRGSNTGSDQRG